MPTLHAVVMAVPPVLGLRVPRQTGLSADFQSQPLAPSSFPVPVKHLLLARLPWLPRSKSLQRRLQLQPSRSSGLAWGGGVCQ